ncbi:MAG: NAD(P)-binding domain-containing protein [Thermoplasmata archaeon]|nr:NAD(P)-binding domain-containing protein [Thermoplasmata archaeon]
MKVGVLGSGVVGKVLSRSLAGRKHDVMIGTRSPKGPELEAWLAKEGHGVRAGTFAEAAEHGELVVLATNGGATLAALDLAGVGHFEGKLVIDATNPLDFSAGFPPSLLFGFTDSLGERVQRKLPNAKVVKCFNTVPNSLMVDPTLTNGTPELIVCGDDAGAKGKVGELVRSLGWSGVIDIGGIREARWQEALVPLWVRVAGARQNFNVTFTVAEGSAIPR